MKDKDLIRTIQSFTRGILGKRKPNGMCLAVCAPLQSFLLMGECYTKLVEGEIHINGDLWNHFWLELKDGRVIDPTASQFKKPDGSGMPKVFIGEKPYWYTINKAHE